MGIWLKVVHFMFKNFIRILMIGVVVLSTTDAFAGDQGNYTDALQAIEAKDYQKAFHDLLPLAEKGDPLSQFKLGTLYDEGLGVEQDTTKAAFWWRRAGAKGHRDALFNLAMLYTQGDGVAKDDEKAGTILQRLIREGKRDAEIDIMVIAMNLFKGRVPSDWEMAVDWVRKAAKQGDADAQYWACYAESFGYHETDKAIEWCRMGARQGYTESMRLLSDMLYLKGNETGQLDNIKAEAEGWLMKAAVAGNAAAQTEVAKGLIVIGDYQEALTWAQKASEQNYSGGQEVLGLMTVLGLGLPRNDKEGARILKLAANDNRVGAQVALCALYLHGRGVPQDTLEAAKWFLIVKFNVEWNERPLYSIGDIGIIKRYELLEEDLTQLVTTKQFYQARRRADDFMARISDWENKQNRPMLGERFR